MEEEKKDVNLPSETPANEHQFHHPPPEYNEVSNLNIFIFYFSTDILLTGTLSKQ
jgi:hypothetical protein